MAGGRSRSKKRPKPRAKKKIARSRSSSSASEEGAVGPQPVEVVPPANATVASAPSDSRYAGLVFFDPDAPRPVPAPVASFDAEWRAAVAQRGPEDVPAVAESSGGGSDRIPLGTQGAMLSTEMVRAPLVEVETGRCSECGRRVIVTRANLSVSETHAWWCSYWDSPEGKADTRTPF